MPLIGHTTHIVTVLLLTLLTACGPATQTPAPAQSEAAVPDGINDRFLDPDLDPDAWTKRWEVETAGFELEREITIPELRENYVLRFRRP